MLLTAASTTRPPVHAWEISLGVSSIHEGCTKTVEAGLSFHYSSQSPGRIQKVDPPILDSDTPMV